MKNILFLIIGAILLNSCADESRTSLKLHYDKPAEYFEEALPLGNGRLGAMVYGGTDMDRISLNDITLWTGEPDKGGEHPDYELIESMTPWGEASQWVEQIRKALDEEDYATADKLQRRLQGHFSENYQPLGWLELVYPEGEVTDYYRELDLSKAVATVQYKKNGKAFKAEYMVSSPDSVVVIRLTGDAPIDAEIKLCSRLPHESKVEGNSIVSEGYTAYHSYPVYYHAAKEKFMYDPDRGVHYRTVVRCEDAVAEGEILKVSGVNETVIYVTNSTSFAGFDKDPVKEGREYQLEALRNSAEAAKKGWKKLMTSHLKDYKELFDRVSIWLGDTEEEIKALPTDQQLLRYADGETNPELEALYFQYGRYLLISSSRTVGVPANLQGIWNEYMLPPWSSNYTVNINLEENYWAAEAAGLPEMHEALLGFVRNLSQNGNATAKNFYGIDRGWCLAHNSDIWAMTCPVGLGTGDPCWANWSFGGAWLATHIWEHWLFNRDMDALKRDYPALKGAAEFCIDYLVEKNNELIPSPTTSPENIYVTPEGYRGSTLYGSTSDLAIIRECLTNAVAAAELLGDEEFAAEAKGVLPRLHGYKVGADGALQEWYHDWRDSDPSHRHQSHLIGAYPGHQIQAGTDLGDAALKTLEIKGFNTTGWSCGWRVNLYARLGDAEGAYKMYRRLLRYVSPDNYQGEDARRGGGTYPNLFDAHSPFQIDGNFGGCAGVIEMLVQSTEDGVKMLPALPAAWPEGYIKGVRTRTGEVVDLSWKDGKVESLLLSKPRR
jgi:alpha-L-fucosidase 2